MKATVQGLRSSALCIAAAVLACSELPGAETKDRCGGPGDCNPGYGCVESVCQRWVNVPGVVSTDSFTKGKSFLVNLVALGSYQVFLQYDATSADVPIHASFGRDDRSQYSQEGTQLSFSSGVFYNAVGVYVLRIEAGDGVTIRQVSVDACPKDSQSDINNCGQCNHVCAIPQGYYKDYHPICVERRCEWQAQNLILPEQVVFVYPAPNTENESIDSVLHGDSVFFDCQVSNGESVSLPGISSTIWDHVPALQGGYIPDVMLFTGMNAMIAPECP